MTTAQWPHQQSGEQPGPWSYATGPAPVEEGGPRRLPILVAAATVLAVVLGAVAYAGIRLWYGSGAQPEQATPASVTAFARLDLSPGYGQRLKINNLAGKFPRDSGSDAVDELEAEIFDDLGIEDEDYRTHVEPWFAKRIGLALWLDAANKPYGLVVLASRDDAAARAGLAQVQRKKGDEFGFVVRDGHALVANGDDGSQAAAEAADADAQRESLAASAKFRRGTDWLPGQQTALAWVDLDRLGPLADKLVGSRAGQALTPGGLLGLGPAGRDAPGAGDLTGQLIVGAAATDNGVEFRFRAFGTGAAAPTGDARSIVDELPGDTALAGSLRIGDFAARADLDDLLPDDLLGGDNPFAALSGATITVAVAALGDEIPLLAASADTTSTQHAKALAEAVELLGGEMTVTTRDNRVELRTKGYAASDGKLSGQALYRQALTGSPDQTYAALYVDVRRLLADAELSEQERWGWAPVKAVGLAAGAEDGDPVGLLRVVIS